MKMQKTWLTHAASLVLTLTLAQAAHAFNPPPDGEPGETGAFERTVEFDGRIREYKVHVPPHYVDDESLPLVVDLHGLLSQNNQQEMISNYLDLHDDPQEGFAIVYPQGYRNSWNAGLCCGTAASEGVDDVAAIRTIVEAVLSEWPELDRSRVYVTGLSNGSAMTQRLGVEASDLFAAGAGYAFMLLAPAPEGRMPFPIINFHGYSDNIVSYNGSDTLPSMAANTTNWAQLNGCFMEPKIERLSPAGTSAQPNQCVIYDSCANGAEVVSCSLRGGHVIYNNRDRINVTRMGWDFMKRFSR